jgi:DnaJ-class molecular chaperone
VTARTTPFDSNRETFYDLLEVDVRATSSEITRAYRRRMKECHPDRMPPGERERTEVVCRHLNHAYATLKDPIRRRQYDQSIQVQEVQDQIMNRYVGGLGGPGLRGQDPHGQRLRRELTDFEKAEMRMTDRSAMFSLVRAVVVLTIGVIALMLLYALLASAIGAMF